MITKQELVETTLKTIDKTQKMYSNWSDGEWLWNAPEYLLTVKIAENIAKIKKSKFITLEDNVEEILGVSGARGQGKMSSDLRANGRFDIVVWWAKGDPRAIIEVKHRVYKFANIEDDIKRICAALKRKTSNSSIKYGLIAFYTSNTYVNDAKNKLNNSIDRYYDKTKELVESNSFKVEDYRQIRTDNDEDVYASVVFLIKR